MPLRTSSRFSVALSFCMFALASSAQADIVEPGTLLQRSDFTLNGTAWNPGPNAARSGGNPAAGSARWSIMTSGLGVHADASSFDPDHSGTTGVFDMLDGSLNGMESAAFEAALNVWAAASQFTNLGLFADGAVAAGAPEASGGHLRDIRVAAFEITTSTTLAHAFQPGTQALFGAGGTIAGDVHFDISQTWVDDPTDTTADADIDFFTVALHEIGHALGLGHSSVVGSVMEATYAGARRTLHADDISGIQAIYGAPLSTVPEPSSLVLLGIGGIAATVGNLFRRRQKALPQLV